MALVVLASATGCVRHSPRVEFLSPKDGAVVASPVHLEMSASGIRIEPAAGVIHPGAGHFHVLVDRDCFRPDAFVEMHTVGFEHFGDGASTASLDLPPGRHTLCLQVGDAAHVTLAPSHQITIIIK